MDATKENYYKHCNLPSPRPFTPLQPQQSIKYQHILNNLKAGEAKSHLSINQVNEKDQLIQHLKSELSLLQDRYRKICEQLDVTKIHETNLRRRQGILQEELEDAKTTVNKLQFQLKMQHIQTDQSGMQEVIRNYEQKIEALHKQLMASSKSKDQQLAILNQQTRKSRQSDNHKLIVELQQMQDQYEQRVGELQQQNGLLKMEIVQLKERSPRNSPRKTEAKIDSARDDSLQRQLQQLKRQRQTEQEEFKAREAKLLQMRQRAMQQMETLMCRMVEVQQQYRELQGSFKSQRLERIDQQSIQHSRTDSMSDLHISIIRELQRKMEEMQVEQQQKQQQMKTTRQQLQDKIDLLDKLKATLTECEGQLEQLDDQHKKVLQDRCRLKQAVELKQNQIEQMRMGSINSKKSVGQSSNLLQSKWAQTYKSRDIVRTVSISVGPSQCSSINEADAIKLRHLLQQLEFRLHNTLEQLLKAKQQQAHSDNKHSEHVKQLEQDKNNLQIQLNSMSLDKSTILSQVKHNEITKYIKIIEDLKTEHRQIMEAEDRAHRQQMETLQMQYEETRNSLLADLQKLKDIIRKENAQHMAEMAILRQTCGTDIKSVQDMVDKYKQELSRVKREYNMMNSHWKKQMDKYHKLKARLQYIKNGFKAVQQCIEEDNSMSSSSISMKSSQYRMVSQEIVVRQMYMEGTIEGGTMDLSSSSRFEIRPIPVECSFEDECQEVEARVPSGVYISPKKKR